METINTPYDDTFRTLLQDCPELVVPLINELFGTNYTGREVVVSNENEIFLRNPEGKKEKRVTDSNLTLISLKGISKRYHLECQSTADGTMEIRMWEYDAQIALRNKEYRNGVLYVKFPDSAVIYLRSNSNTPDELKICICVGKKEIFYEIPILKVKNYTLNEIFEKQLWMLIPFYIFRYEKEFRKINGDEKRLRSLRMEYENVAARLDQECQSGRMKPITGGALCELANTVVEKLASKYDNVEKEVTEVMGGKVLNYRSKEIFREAMGKGTSENEKMDAGRVAIPQAMTRKPESGSSRTCWVKRRPKSRRNSRPRSVKVSGWTYPKLATILLRHGCGRGTRSTPNPASGPTPNPTTPTILRTTSSPELGTSRWTS